MASDLVKNAIENRTILQGQVLQTLAEAVPSNSIDCVITSPPYWDLRDYGIAEQWGLEPDFREYLKKLRDLMVELKRVLKPTGSCWINLGDTYSGGYNHSDWEGCTEDFDQRRKTDNKFQAQLKNQLEAKSRYGIPERFYAQCIDDGWIARNHIPWYKENSMPSSVKDRFTNKWESVFFFVKSQKYYFNLDAVREKPKTETKPFNLRVREAKRGKGQMKLGDDPRAWKMSDREDVEYNAKGERKQDAVLGADGKPKKTYEGFNERYRAKLQQGKPDSKARIESRTAQARAEGKDHDACLNHPQGKNPRDFFFENSKAREHYDENGFCFGCGEHWSKHTVSERAKGSMGGAIKRSESICWCNAKGKNPGDVFFINPHPFAEAHFATFPIALPLKILKCACPPNGMVLDPFFGSGTVGVAAEKLGLNWMGIELKAEYIEIARKRLQPFMNKRLV